MIDDRHLFALAAGALEPGDALAVRERVAAEGLDGRLAWAREVVDEQPRSPLGAFLGAGLGLQLQTVLDGDGPGAGDRIVLHVRAPGDPADWRVVLLHGGRALHPTGPEDWSPLSRFRGEGAQRELDLVLPEAGAHLQLLLVPRDRAVDWSLPEPERWEGLLEAARAGEIPGWTLSP